MEAGDGTEPAFPFVTKECPELNDARRDDFSRNALPPLYQCITALDIQVESISANGMYNP